MRELCEQRASRLIQMDRQKMTAEVAPGIVVPLRPFWGSMGVAPAPSLGRVSSNPPSRHAGNLDNRELVAGSTLYIPVLVKGALLEIGDGHAAQGDGEADQTAIETNLRGRIQAIVRKDVQLEGPPGVRARCRAPRSGGVPPLATPVPAPARPRRAAGCGPPAR